MPQRSARRRAAPIVMLLAAGALISLSGPGQQPEGAATQLRPAARHLLSVSPEGSSSSGRPSGGSSSSGLSGGSSSSGRSRSGRSRRSARQEDGERRLKREYSKDFKLMAADRKKAIEQKGDQMVTCSEFVNKYAPLTCDFSLGYLRPKRDQSCQMSKCNGEVCCEKSKYDMLGRKLDRSSSDRRRKPGSRRAKGEDPEDSTRARRSSARRGDRQSSEGSGHKRHSDDKRSSSKGSSSKGSSSSRSSRHREASGGRQSERKGRSLD
eukprot:TRINITY_DN14256_c0_g2_i1.p1 TRINITY_DN14256_c0_g2~~TRINITY_DN14256_c0_g2_i1.p1  ORF type:complete len:292 (+),score=101.16 TRINITY_DN14256_c0_g2_i1:81-878(+)